LGSRRQNTTSGAAAPESLAYVVRRCIGNLSSLLHDMADIHGQATPIWNPRRLALASRPCMTVRGAVEVVGVL